MGKVTEPDSRLGVKWLNWRAIEGKSFELDSHLREKGPNLSRGEFVELETH